MIIEIIVELNEMKLENLKIKMNELISWLFIATQSILHCIAYLHIENYFQVSISNLLILIVSLVHHGSCNLMVLISQEVHTKR